jgi:hypothetical protein
MQLAFAQTRTRPGELIAPGLQFAHAVIPESPGSCSLSSNGITK